METLSFPRCPKCADGGNVRLIQVNSTESPMFSPLPKGWENAVPMFACECGWTEPVSESDPQTKS